VKRWDWITLAAGVAAVACVVVAALGPAWLV
jgi:hypothetical protein